jgi:Tol biopolymer transport system component
MQPVLFPQNAPDGTQFMSGGVLSPDGERIAFVAKDEESGQQMLWVRSLRETMPSPLPGTEGATRPFWAPDGESLGFFAKYSLHRVGLDGDPPRTLATIGLNPTGGCWGEDGTILFSVTTRGIFSVSANGGAVTEVTTPDRSAKESFHSMPQWLPSGGRFLYVVGSQDANRAGTYLRSPDGESRRITAAQALFSRDGYLLFVRGQALLAQRFDPDTGRLMGEELTVVGNVPPGAPISTSRTGLLAYGGNTGGWRSTWYSRSGERLGSIDAPALLYNIRLSRDGRLLYADGGADIPRRDVWMVDLERGGSTLMGPGSGPMPSPDGVRVAFTSDRRTGVADVYAFSKGEEEVVHQSTEPKSLTDWTSDGRYVVYVSRNPTTRADLWVLPTAEPDKPMPFLRTAFNEIQGRVSPDGRWIAYTSDESGRWEVYLQSFPMPGVKRAVSVGGGAQPQWRGDGRELFYLAPDRRIMVVNVDLSEGAEFTRPRALFQVGVPGSPVDILSQYAVSPDGQRFLVNSTDESGRAPITTIVNWQALLGS